MLIGVATVAQVRPGGEISYIYPIRQLREVTDETLTIYDLDEEAYSYPFRDWSDARILGYCYHEERDDSGTLLYTTIYPHIPIEVLDAQDVAYQALQGQVPLLDFIAGITEGYLAGLDEPTLREVDIHELGFIVGRIVQRFRESDSEGG